MHKSTALRLLHLFSLLPSTLAQLSQVVCYDITSPRHPEQLTPVDCWSDFLTSQKMRGGGGHNGGGGGGGQGKEKDDDGYDTDKGESSSNDANLPFFDFAPYSPLSSMLQQPAAPPPSWQSQSQITFNLDCNISPDTCYAMQSTLDLAGWYVSQVISFRAPLQMNASLTDFCQVYGACNSSAGTDVILGGAVPARTFPLIDDDGVVRYYPQAVIRQMYFPPGEAPQCGPIDVLMEFNSNIDFFYERPNPSNMSITSNQFDFLTVAIHEMMHGLGFLSSWADYLTPSTPTTLTPQIALGNPSSQSSVQFEGFVEYAYDRLMSFTDHPHLFATNLTAEMIQDFSNEGTTYNTSADLGSAFLASPAKAIAVSMDANATTHGAIQQSLPLIYSNNATLQSNFTPGPVITLETSFRPFASGSSLNHVDGTMYLSTPDFLMRFSTPMGKSLQDLINDYGTTGDTNYGPFGPGLRYILGGMGYRIRGGVPLGGSTPNAEATASGLTGGTSTNSTGSSSLRDSSAGRGRSWSWVTGVLWIIGVSVFTSGVMG